MLDRQRRADALALELLTLVGARGARQSLIRARSRWTPALATTAMVYLSVTFCELRRIDPSTKERRPHLTRADVLRAISGMRVPIGGELKRLSFSALKKAHQRGVELAKDAAGRKRLWLAVVAIRPDFARLAATPPFNSEIVFALMTRRVRLTATLT